MDEFEFIDRIRPASYSQPSLIRGIGDDAAVFRGSKDTVVATDTFVDKIHFSDQTTTPYHIGWRALAANVSDIAAMGADPIFYLVSIVIPDGAKEKLLLGLYNGMKDLASTFRMDLIGGDTVTGKELTLSVTVIGYVDRNKSRYRSSAKENDVIFVSGTLGDARAGLEILINKLENIQHRTHLISRHQLPIPQVSLGKLLQQVDRVALNDVSDGIANELEEIATASDTTMVIDDARIPVHAGLQEFSMDQQFDWKYFGGEDFELLGTVAEHNWPIIQKAASDHQLKLTAIGKVIHQRRKQPPVLLRRNDTIEPLLKKGYSHLKQVNQ